MVTLTLEFDLLYENFNFVNNIWIVSAKALIFHKPFRGYKQMDLVTLTLESGTLAPVNKI